jgi:type IV pilus assembly protein PilN
MIRINLLPVKELKAEVSRRRELTIGGTALGVTLIVFGGLYVQQSYRISKLGSEIAGLQSELQTLNVKVKQVGDLQEKVKQLKSKNKIIEDLNKKKVGPARVMESLSVATPTSLWLTEFKETGGKLVINGLAVDNQTVADFLRTLATFSYFSDVELVETTQETQGTGPFKKFSVKALVSYNTSPINTGAEARGSAPAKEEKKG